MNRVVNEEYAKRLQAVLVRSLVETGLFHDIPSDQDREFLLEFMMSNEERLGRGLPIAPEVWEGCKAREANRAPQVVFNRSTQKEEANRCRDQEKEGDLCEEEDRG